MESDQLSWEVRLLKSSFPIFLANVISFTAGWVLATSMAMTVAAAVLS